MTNAEIEGGCFCGSVRYRARVAPVNSMICHCRSCRRVAAAPVVAWVTFPRDRFDFVRGAPTTLQSSPPVQRTFCPRCGTGLTCARDDDPETIDVTTCSLDAPDAYPPTHHSWLAHDLSWVRFGDGRPTFRQSRYPAGS